MPNYRRSRAKGGTYFFTVNTLERQKKLLTRNIDALRAAFKKVKQNHPYSLDALVLLPDHFHMVITLPTGSEDFSTIIRLTKGEFTKRVSSMSNDINLSRQIRKEKGIWQRRFWEHQIRDNDDYQNHIDYCYINPVKHGWVKSVIDWPYSTFHRDVKRGLYPREWAIDVDEVNCFGE